MTTAKQQQYKMLFIELVSATIWVHVQTAQIITDLIFHSLTPMCILKNHHRQFLTLHEHTNRFNFVTENALSGHHSDVITRLHKDRVTDNATKHKFCTLEWLRYL